MPLTLPGNYNIQELTLISSFGKQIVDLIPLYSEIEIFESILSPSISGYISVTDTFNLISGLKYSLPIMGNEVIYIKAQLPDYYVENERGEWVPGDPKSLNIMEELLISKRFL